MISFFTKQELKTKVSKSGIRYGLFLLIVNLSLIWATKYRNSATKEQQFNLFVASGVNDSLKTDLRSILDDSIYEINVYSFSYTDEYYNEFYTLYGPSESDIVIAPTQTQNSITNNYSILSNYSATTLDFDGNAYGIEVYNCQNSSGTLTKYLLSASSINYYLYVSNSSVHNGKSSNFVRTVIENLFL